MITPTIHLNGTSREALLEAVCTAGQAVDEAMTALCKAAPHGRDYYPQGAGALAEAEATHREWLAKLREVYDELMALALRINEVGR